MICVCRLIVPGGSGVGVGGVRGPAVLGVVRENRWPWVCGSFVLADQVVMFFYLF